ncbi:MAG: hypothetical protein D6680_17625 [Cyanobacteria bacterium J007]|nr:MAG: hypothetical protein D6680_17625 [Cyanobacteria bacterium J007]
MGLLFSAILPRSRPARSDSMVCRSPGLTRESPTPTVRAEAFQPCIADLLSPRIVFWRGSARHFE